MPPDPSMGMSSPQGAPQPQNLLGPNDAPTQAGPTPEQAQQALMAEVRDITMRITALARQYPDGAEDAEVATQSLINFMTKCVISSSTTEPSNAPNLLG